MKQIFTITCVFSIFISSALAAEKTPNVLLFIVDDMGVMDSSVPSLTDGNGKAVTHPQNQLYRTPSMEKLASQGTRFETFYANSVCSPTRVSIMTGQSSARHHTTQWIRSEANNRGAQGPPEWQWKGIEKEQETLPVLLQKNGYYTIYVGKAHLGPFGAEGEFPNKIGFTKNIAGCSYGQPGSYYGIDGFGWIKGNKKRAVPDLTSYHGKDIFLTEALSQEMNVALTTAVETKKPFFACMAYYAVHAPFQANKKLLPNYADKDISDKSKAFATLIESMDNSVGEVTAHLEKLGVAEDTLILFVGDNGTDAPLDVGKGKGRNTHGVQCAAPLRGKKATHYEGGMRVPFIATWAKVNPENLFQKKLPIKAGHISSDIGTIHDIFPTVLESLGIDYSTVTDGINIAPAFAGKAVYDKPREFLMHFPHAHRSSYFTAYRLGEWKIIYHYLKPADTRYELFHLPTDQSESKNLAVKDTKNLKRMFVAMQKALDKAGAQYPVERKDNSKEMRPIPPKL